MTVGEPVVADAASNVSAYRIITIPEPPVLLLPEPPPVFAVPGVPLLGLKPPLPPPPVPPVPGLPPAG